MVKLIHRNMKFAHTLLETYFKEYGQNNDFGDAPSRV